MSAIRDRVNKIQTTIADRMGTGDNDMDVELIFTQFRKAAEGTAYALLAANKIEYAAKHADISTVWKAKELIKRLNAVNPNFYPVGLSEPHVSDPGFRRFRLALASSLVLAAAAFVAPFRGDPHWAIPFSLWMQGIWLILFITNTLLLRRRALWFLLEIPVVFYWLLPAMLFGCAWGPYACV